MIPFLKYLKGYLRIKVWGFSPERFINLCGNRNILLWDICQEDGIYTMYISLKGFYALRQIVRKTGTRVAILKRYGLPFFVPTLLARKIFLLGFLVCVGCWIASSFFIWNINIEGNLQITDDMFQSFLEGQQIRIGSKKDKVDLTELEKQIRNAFPEVTWTSAKILGTKLEIAIKENDAPILPEGEEKAGIGQDLVTPYQGVIVSMIVRKGVPKVKIGDTVEAGALLVEGRIPVINDDLTVREYQYVDADADIVVEHILSHEEALPYDYIAKDFTGRTKKRIFVRVGNRELRSLTEVTYPYYDSVVSEHTPSLFRDLRIPVLWGSYTYREYLNVEHEYSLEEAEYLLAEKMNQFLINLAEKGVQIIEKNVKMDTEAGRWIISGSFLVQEKVEEKRPTTMEVVPPTPEDSE
jgi:similar to stage IV sporulation protein